VQYSVRDFIRKSAAQLGISLAFVGEGASEQAVVQTVKGNKASSVKPGDVIVKVDPRYFRPSEVATLLGDPGKAKADLGWIPQITLDEMIAEMVAHDLEAASRHALLKQHGYAVAVSKED
jgi:GDPmannose 4,6-dehydratase